VARRGRVQRTQPEARDEIEQLVHLGAARLPGGTVAVKVVVTFERRDPRPVARRWS
jgi:hypothetical protein